MKMENKKITTNNDACGEKRHVRFSFSDDDDAIAVDQFNYDTDEGSLDGERTNSKSSASDSSLLPSKLKEEETKDSCAENNNDNSKQQQRKYSDDHVTSRWSSHGSSSDSSPILKKRAVDFTRWSSTKKSTATYTLDLPSSSAAAAAPPCTLLLA